MKRKHQHILRFALMIGTVFALGAASAAPAQSFDALLMDHGLDPADPQVLSHSMALHESAEMLGVELALEGLYFDGRTFLLGWRTDNLRPEQPALVLYTNVTLGGISVGADAYADFPLSQWWPQVFGLFVTGDPVNDLMGAFTLENAQDYALHGVQEVAVYFTVKRPHLPVAVVDANIHTPYADAAAETDRQSMLAAMAACGVTVAQPDELDARAWQDQGYLVVNRAGELLHGDGAAGDMTLLNGEDLIDADVADITLSFTVDYDALVGK